MSFFPRPFLISFQDNVRRFRVKFAKMGPINDRENCQDFTRAVSAHVQVKTMESQEDENSQANSQSMLADATQLSSSVEYLPPSKSTRDDVTDSQIFSTKSIRQITDVSASNIHLYLSTGGNKNGVPNWQATFHITNIVLGDAHCASYFLRCQKKVFCNFCGFDAVFSFNSKKFPKI